MKGSGKEEDREQGKVPGGRSPHGRGESYQTTSYPYSATNNVKAKRASGSIH